MGGKRAKSGISGLITFQWRDTSLWTNSCNGGERFNCDSRKNQIVEQRPNSAPKSEQRLKRKKTLEEAA